MSCLACDAPAETEYDLSFEGRDGEPREMTVALCGTCADDLLARDWLTGGACDD